MKNKLLIVGIDKYINHQNLNTCVRDVIDFKNILLEKFDFEESDVYELLNEKATNKNIQDALRGYSRTLNKEDNLIIFFSGHGSYSSTEERGFWIPYDGTKDYTTWVPNETIITFFKNMKCRHLFLISDSCFSNSLLNQGLSKSNKDYSNRQSRWALTSAFDESYEPKDSTSNSLFAETIIEYLENIDEEFRISKLIEYVKDSFSTNIMQTPQGSPLIVEGHKGGEMVLTINQEIDLRGLKGYEKFKSVLELYKRNANFEEIETYEDKSKKVGFQLYKELDPVVNRLTYYLYLYSGINQTQTLKYLNQHQSEIFSNKNLIIFTSKEKKQQDLNKRLSNIKRKFKPINIFYLDEFIRDSCTPKFPDNDDDSKFLHISNFILPTYASNGISENILDSWISKDSDPILVIKGTGGIGKTTFAHFIADNVILNSPKTSVIFIDSVQIKDNLLKQNNNLKDIDIYNFYEALYNQDSKDDTKLTKELFQLNIDAGNILIIIDGLDEVISKIPNFNVEVFLKSIEDSSNELGSGKVIITCRTHFWNNSSTSNNNFKIIELKPFDEKQTKEFFIKSFDSSRKQKKALKLANDFSFSDPNDDIIVYHPYVLDIIRSIISSEQEDIELDLTEFSSTILNTDVKNDYIIYRVCDRERKRIGQISVDEQVNFFIYLANERRGNINTFNLKTEIENALGKHIDKVNIEAFKSHPFLQNIGSSTVFKYDFFSELFKSMYISRYFNYESETSTITNHFTNIISENCWYGSSLNTEIVKRIKSWTEYDILQVSDIIRQVGLDDLIQEEKKRAVIANIFNISLSINHHIHINNINANTKLLKSIFNNSNNIIENLSIINLNSEKEIRFDFSDLEIYKAFIDSYNSFYECHFNEKTIFNKCNLLNIVSNNSKNTLSKKIFMDCIFDKNIERVIEDTESKQKQKVDKVKQFLNSFFHLFYSNGKLGRQWELEVIKPRFQGIDKYNYGYKKTIRLMKRFDVINAKSETKGVKFSISEMYKEDIVRYVKDGTISKIITTLIKEFSR